MGLVLSMGFGMAYQERMGMSGKAVDSASDKIRARVHATSLSNISSEASADCEQFGLNRMQIANSDIDGSIGNTARESSFAQVSMGQGWATLSGDANSSEGDFARIFWVEKTFVNSSNEDNDTTTTNAALTDLTVIKGGLKIGSNMYKLNLESETANSMVFDVTNEKDDTTGTLTLNMGESLVGFTVWSGTLALDSGKVYDIEVSTKNSKVAGGMGDGTGMGNQFGKDKDKDKASSNEQPKKATFGEKMRGWFGRK